MGKSPQSQPSSSSNAKSYGLNHLIVKESASAQKLPFKIPQLRKGQLAARIEANSKDLWQIYNKMLDLSSNVSILSTRSFIDSHESLEDENKQLNNKDQTLKGKLKEQEEEYEEEIYSCLDLD